MRRCWGSITRTSEAWMPKQAASNWSTPFIKLHESDDLSSHQRFAIDAACRCYAPGAHDELWGHVLTLQIWNQACVIRPVPGSPHSSAAEESREPHQ